MNRRGILQGIGVGLALAAIGPFAFAQSANPTLIRLRVGYLHGVASDAHLWIGEHLGSWKQQGLELQTTQFVTGLEAYQALVGGSLDVVTTGAVISNFPARGQGKAFLINGIEFATAQLWVDPASGIRTIADLKGRKIATTRGTTAHVFLHRALAATGLDSNKDIEIVHQRMNDAVTAFIAGAVPAVATWVPLDAMVRKQMPAAVRLADASQYPDAAILNGWSARNDVFARNQDVLRRFIQGWLPANELLATRPDEALAILQKTKYPDFTIADLRAQYDTARWYPAAEWRKLYRDGSITRWLNKVTDFNVEVGAFKDPIPAEHYFDPSLFLGVATG